jgi:hypothetical protein
MPTPVIPVARALILCDFQIAGRKGKVDLIGAFNAIRPPRGYPYEQARFCVFAQLTGGLGAVPFFVDIRSLDTDELIRTTETRALYFPSREYVVQMALTIEGCRFPKAGLYAVDLFCDNVWVCDTRLLLK